MAFREVAVTEIREVLRAWLSGAGLRKVAEQAGVDRKTARRYRRLDIPPRGLAVHACLLGYPAQPNARQPRAQHLTDLSHRNLPERQPEPPSRLT